MTVKIRLNTSYVLRNGKYQLVFQLLHLRRKRIIATPYHLAEDEFDPVSEQAITRHHDIQSVSSIQEINQYLTHEKMRLQKIIHTSSCQHDNYALEKIVQEYFNDQNRHFLLAFIDYIVTELRQEGRIATSYSYKSTYSALTRFGCTNKMAIQEITFEFLKRFMHFLSNEGLLPNSIALYIRVLRAVYNRAVDSGIIQENKNPFYRLKVRREKTLKRAVAKQILCKVADMDLTARPSLAFSRDLFMFSFYARGMSFVDIVFLKQTNVHGDFILYRRHKTRQQLRIKISPQMQSLIQKYENASPYLFPILQSSAQNPYTQYKTALLRHNRHLKKIGRELGLENSLTSYVARHSWATIAKRSGIPISVISEGLGHTNEKTTAIYLDSFEEDVVDQANEIVTRLRASDERDMTLSCV